MKICPAHLENGRFQNALKLREIGYVTQVDRLVRRHLEISTTGGSTNIFFGLIESAIRKEATEILLTPVQELDMVRMDFGRLHCWGFLHIPAKNPKMLNSAD
jgi:hypothetical protein